MHICLAQIRDVLVLPNSLAFSKHTLFSLNHALAQAVPAESNEAPLTCARGRQDSPLTESTGLSQSCLYYLLAA